MKISLVTIFRILIGLLLFWLLILAINCSNSARKKAEKEKYNKTISELDSIISVRDIEIANYEVEKVEFAKKREIEKVEKAKLVQKVTDLSITIKEQKAKAKNNTPTENVNYYNERYTLEQKAKLSESGIELPNTMVTENIQELIDYDGTKQELSLTKEIVVKTESELAICDSVNAINEKEIKALFDKYFLANNKFETADEAYKKELKENSKEVVFRLLGGLEYGNSQLLTNSIFKGNIMFQTRNGSLFTASIDTKQNYYVGYNFSIFALKGKKK